MPAATSTTYSTTEARSDDVVLKLPHPYYSTYRLVSPDRHINNLELFQVRESSPSKFTPYPDLQNGRLLFSKLSDPKNGKRPPESNNTAWARARRAPSMIMAWDGDSHPTVAQVWLAIYVTFTLRPDVETFRMQLQGLGSLRVAESLKAVMLATGHPSAEQNNSKATSEEVLVLRGAFWQGAGSPFGPRPVWAPDCNSLASGEALSSYGLAPPAYTMTTRFPEARVHSKHPVHPPKPTPGSVIYSRWIPHLKEQYEMIALDYENPTHLQLFHDWQNDPRVSQGWNESGSLEHHRNYLRNLHEDPHILTVLAAFEGTLFAYFEIYWAKEDHLGAYYQSQDFDRGRHSLVGDVRFRGPHRVSAWWSGIMHYIFLDEPRTTQIVGEPKYTNSSVLMYDFIHGFGMEGYVDLPHKRSALMRCTRERFFQICPLEENRKVVGGTLVGVTAKL